MIRLDNDYIFSVVITCTKCPQWSEVRFDMEEAHACAVNHEKQWHPEVSQAYDAARKWRARLRKKQATLEPV